MRATEAERRDQKRYREKHREEIRARGRARYREKPFTEEQKRRRVEARKRWYDTHRLEVLAKAKKARAENPEVARAYDRRWREANPDKAKAADRGKGARYRAKHPEKIRARRFVNYRITQKDYDEMLAAQSGACSICNAEAQTERGGILHVDHCHTTGTVRGLLCTRCNKALGGFQDSREILGAAILYLDGHR